MTTVLTPEAGRWLCWAVAMCGAALIVQWPHLHPPMSWVVMVLAVWSQPSQAPMIRS